MKKTKETKVNLKGVLLTLTMASVMQSCLPSSDKPYASKAVTCEASKASNMNAALDEQNPAISNDDLFQDVTNFKEQITTQHFTNDRQDKDIRQTRNVRIDVATLRKRLLERRSNRFHLPLLNNKSINVILDDVNKYSDTNVIATGKTDSDGLSSVTLVINNDVVVAHVEENDRQEHYEIKYSGNNIHSVQEVNHEAEDCLEVEPEQRANFSVEMDTAVPMAAPTIDVLVAYTSAAKNSVGGADAVKALIQMGVADSNKAYANSGVTLNLRLVGTLEVTQKEGSFTSDLSYLKGTSDGKWDSVHAERRRVGADLVALVAYYPNSSTAGIGYIGSTYSSGFSITKTTAFKQFSFTHELGHNIGLQHSDGYENSSGRFRTVMAYGTYPRIARFSNPSIDYNSYATGTTSNNSAKKINSNAARISSLTASVFQSETPKPSEPIGGEAPADPCTEADTPEVASE